MLSILIPVYNYDITKLVNEIHRQVMDSFVDFEIVVIEDGSRQFLEENKKIEKLLFCSYEALDKNIGRSAVRNRLADKAKYDHLLFLDCDGEVNSSHYVEKYLSFCNEDSVVIGGTAYDKTNRDKKYSLRLKYGRAREARMAMERERDGKYSHFSTFNFLISKNIFQKIRFDETIRGYGHEDTLFGHQIAEMGCEVHHIDNPLIHKGLDNNETFLRKTEEGTRNLYFLHQTGDYPFLANQSKLLSTFIRIQERKLTPFFSSLFKFSGRLLRKNLTGKCPSLFIFDIYKLLYLANISHEK